MLRLKAKRNIEPSPPNEGQNLQACVHSGADRDGIAGSRTNVRRSGSLESARLSVERIRAVKCRHGTRTRGILARRTGALNAVLSGFQPIALFLSVKFNGGTSRAAQP